MLYPPPPLCVCTSAMQMRQMPMDINMQQGAGAGEGIAAGVVVGNSPQNAGAHAAKGKGGGYEAPPSFDESFGGASHTTRIPIKNPKKNQVAVVQAPPSYECDFDEASPSKPSRSAPSAPGGSTDVFQHPVKPGKGFAPSSDDYEYPVKPGKGTVGAAGGGASGKESEGTDDDSSDLMSD